MKNIASHPCGRGVSIRKPTSQHSTFTHPPLSSNQSINMLFPVMMGKSIWEVSSPLSPSLLLHFSESLKGPVVKVESIFKDCSGCDWMRRLMKLDKHTQKNVLHRRPTDGVWLLFLTNLTYRQKKKMASDWPKINWSLLLYKKKTKIKQNKKVILMVAYKILKHLSCASLCWHSSGMFVLSVSKHLLTQNPQKSSFLHYILFRGSHLNAAP